MSFVTIIPETVDGVEFLPLETETPLYTKPDYIGMSKTELRNIFVYRAIQERENYFQTHTPPAFGDPHYSRLDGYVQGLIAGYGLNFQENKNWITITDEKNRIVMKIRRPEETDGYRETVWDNTKTLRELGL